MFVIFYKKTVQVSVNFTMINISRQDLLLYYNVVYIGRSGDQKKNKKKNKQTQNKTKNTQKKKTQKKHVVGLSDAFYYANQAAHLL